MSRLASEGVVASVTILQIVLVMEKSREYLMIIYMCFIDYTKAFNCVVS